RFAVHPPPLLEIDVTMLQFKALLIMFAVTAETDSGGPRISDLARWLNVTTATASTLVERLVDRGLVERREDPLDRRQHRCRPSSAGQQLVVRFFEATRSQSRELLSVLDEDELQTVLDAAKILIAAAARYRAAAGIDPDAECPVTEEALRRSQHVLAASIESNALQNP
ncbi:MAG TPA: MarR family winged helix-turn-helix transcriptional regulator, partial [Chloroflexota bacterium]|nr:MarR family winged helix-turn-helix transcriptional regulator [Chloroflexota bacterium]